MKLKDALLRGKRQFSPDFFTAEVISAVETRLIRAEAVAAARRNARTAGVEHLIEFGVCDFAATSIPAGGGVVVLNPEYGRRMGDREKLKDIYRAIGDFFKRECQGYGGYVFTGNLDLAKQVGLRSRRRIPFFNGDIECRLLPFDLYEGSRRPRAAAAGEETEAATFSHS